MKSNTLLFALGLLFTSSLCAEPNPLLTETTDFNPAVCEETINHQKNEISKLKESLLEEQSKYSQKEEELETLQGEFDILSEKKKDFDTIITFYKEKLEQQKKDCKDEKYKLKRHLEHQHSVSIDRYESIIKDKDNRITSLESEIASLKERVQSYVDETEIVKQENVRLNEQITSLQEELASCSQKVESAGRERSRSPSLHHQPSPSRDDEKSKHTQELEDKVEKVKERKEEFKRLYEVEKKKREALEKERDEEKEEPSDLAAELATPWQEEVEELREKTEEQERELSRYQEETASQQKELSRYQEEKERKEQVEPTLFYQNISRILAGINDGKQDSDSVEIKTERGEYKSIKIKEAEALILMYLEKYPDILTKIRTYDKVTSTGIFRDGRKNLKLSIITEAFFYKPVAFQWLKKLLEKNKKENQLKKVLDENDTIAGYITKKKILNGYTLGTNAENWGRFKEQVRQEK